MREIKGYLVIFECVASSFLVNVQVDRKLCWRSAAAKRFSSRRVGGIACGRDIMEGNQAGSWEVEVPNLET